MDKNILWVEKYRPKKLKDMILPDETRTVFENWIDKKEIPHLLLVGKQGSGKTTLARIVIDSILENTKTDLLVLNGSANRGIDTVRGIIEDFLKTIAFGGSKIKIVFIDEADMLTTEAQCALRNIIEKYEKTSRFIFTANHESKFEPAILSRFQSFKFSSLPRDYVFKHVENILKLESIEYNSTSLEKIIMMFDSDVRKIINAIEGNIINGKLSVSIEKMSSNEKICISLIHDLIDAIESSDSYKISDTMKKFQQFLKDSDIDYRCLFEDISMDDSIPFWALVPINTFQCKHSSAMVPQMNFMAMLFKIVEVGKSYRALVT